MQQAGLWYGIAHEARITDPFVETVKNNLVARFGPWSDKLI